MDYLKYSKKRRQEAIRILYETDLFNRLKRFGKVKQIGSYALDLMVKPDLDFALRIKRFSDIDKVIRQILEMSKDIINISFKKVVDRRKLGLDGKSLHLYYHDKDLWGIDIFVSTKNFSEYDKISKMVKDNITLKKKKEILRLKYLAYKSKKKVKNNSYPIYLSVLDKSMYGPDGI